VLGRELERELEGREEPELEEPELVQVTPDVGLLADREGKGQPPLLELLVVVLAATELTVPQRLPEA
jgi:hypothetical protein